MIFIKQFFFIFLILTLSQRSIIDAAYSDLKNFEYDHEQESTTNYWMTLGKKEIQLNLKSSENKRSKNVILFLGDGMGISTITASRILKGQLNGQSGEEGYLFFERNFPNTALIKTYNVDRMVPDSAGTGTCYLSGVKSNYEVIGVNAAVKSSEENCETIQKNKVDSIMEVARRAGKSIGVVTTTRITHATPAASYAHVAHRNHESYLPDKTKNDTKKRCKDIATQLIENEPGASFSVILGGGRTHFLPTSLNGSRTDEINLIQKWKEIKAKKFKDNKMYQYIQTVDELNSIDVDKVEHLFGLFNMDHITYNQSLPETNRKEPTLREMTEVAIKILSKNAKGFVLLVEGGRIDLASHANNAYQALHETVHFDQTIESASKLVKNDDTFILVTADHSHTLVLNGYPTRGTNIFGVADRPEYDNENKSTGKFFTILSYGNGPGKKFKQERADPKEQDELGTSKYINYAGVRVEDSTHGGEDVALFSNTWPNLVRGVKEQNYIGHIIQYASCIGPYENEAHCDLEQESSNKIWTYLIVAVFVISLIVFISVYIYKRKQCT